MKITYCILVLLWALGACKQALPNINERASLPATFQFEKMGLKVINAVIHPASATTGILYGNNNALEALKNTDRSINGEKVLVLVTWQQQDDPNWFGARSPSDFLMMEILKTNDSFDKKEKIAYEIVNGKNFKTNNHADTAKRIGFITSIQPAIMP